MIVTQNLSKHFINNGHTIRAVDNLSMSLPFRQFIALTGPSGCGKTTLLSLLGSLEKPTDGNIIIDGIMVNTLRGRNEALFRRTKIGFVFQFFHLVPNLSALENVLLPMDIAGIRTSQLQQKAKELLRAVGIDDDHQHHRPGKLSGGQQQRVAIARALVNDPAVLLADEPTGNVDRDTSQRIIDLLRHLVKQGQAVIVATHDERIANEADICIKLEDGHIIAQI